MIIFKDLGVFRKEFLGVNWKNGPQIYAKFDFRHFWMVLQALNRFSYQFLTLETCVKCQFKHFSFDFNILRSFKDYRLPYRQPRLFLRLKKLLRRLPFVFKYHKWISIFIPLKASLQKSSKLPPRLARPFLHPCDIKNMLKSPTSFPLIL